MMQKFAAHERHEFSNGAIGWRPGGPWDCLGPFALVEQCPIAGTDLRRTCYAQDYPDTLFSIPAVCRVNNRQVRGFFTVTDNAVQFVPYASEEARLKKGRNQCASR